MPFGMCFEEVIHGFLLINRSDRDKVVGLRHRGIAEATRRRGFVCFLAVEGSRFAMVCMLNVSTCLGAKKCQCDAFQVHLGFDYTLLEL